MAPLRSSEREQRPRSVEAQTERRVLVRLSAHCCGRLVVIRARSQRDEPGAARRGGEPPGVLLLLGQLSEATGDRTGLVELARFHERLDEIGCAGKRARIGYAFALRVSPDRSQAL